MTSVTAPATREISASYRRWIVPGGAVTALALVTAYTAVRNPYHAGAFPSCVFYSTTGWYCPGCGGLRAAHELLHGHIGASLAMNPLVLLLVVPLVVGGFAWWFARVAGLKVPEFTLSTKMAWVLPAFLGVFWIVRNLPGMEFLRP